jgi:hypothetical protein
MFLTSATDTGVQQRSADVPGLLRAFRTWCRSLLFPKQVREAEEAGPAVAAHGTLPPPVPRTDPWAGLTSARRRLQAVEQKDEELDARMEALAEIFGRGPGEEHREEEQEP